VNPIVVVMLGVGGLMVWCGITNRDPITVVKSVLTNQGVPAPNSGFHPGTGTPSGTTYGSADALERQAGNTSARIAQRGTSGGFIPS
jgi:hypothetical protein